MTKGIKAIPTVYKGVEYRSKLEAVVAQAFDRMGLEYEYEPRIFINDSYVNVSYGVHQYKPDFYLPGCNTWAEVAGEWDAQHRQNARVFLADVGCYGWYLDEADSKHDVAPETSLTAWKEWPRFIAVLGNDGRLSTSAVGKDGDLWDLMICICDDCGRIYFCTENDYWGCPYCGGYHGNPRTLEIGERI